MQKQKTVLIIARYEWKCDARKVAYLVRSSGGSTTYQTYLFDGKATSCECPSRKPCKHMDLAEQHEAERQGEQFLEGLDEDKKLIEWTAEELERNPKFPTVIDLDGKCRPMFERKKSADHAALNGNRGFSLLRR